MKFMEKLKAKMPGIILAFLLLFVGIMLGACIRLQNKLEELGNQLMYLQDTNSILNEEIYSLQTNIETALQEEASLMEDYSVEVLEMDFEKGIYQVKVSVIPKTYSDNTRTSVFFGVNEFPLVLNRYSFEGIVELSFSDKYDGNMTFLFANGDKKNTEIAKDYVGIQTKLKDLLYGSIKTIPSYRNGQLVFDHSVRYILNEYEDKKYESLELVLMVEEKEVRVVNLLKEDADVDENDSSLDANGTGNASVNEATSNVGEDGQIQEDVEEADNLTDTQLENEAESSTIGEEEETTISEEIEAVLGKSGQISFKKTISVEDGKKVRLFLRAKNEIGFVLEYDLFSAVTSQTGPNGYAETEDYFISNYSIYDSNRKKLQF